MARQKLGQHFLHDQSILRRTAEAACAKDEPHVTEIGPGRGALTRHLLTRAQKVTAIEIDPELARYIRDHLPQVTLIEGDALRVDLSLPGPIVGNLPYYVATPIISRVLRARRPATFLIQKEVAQRVTAQPGNRDYGYFSIECRLFADTEYLFTVPPSAFRPPPKVESAVIRLTPRDTLDFADPEPFLGFASRCFRHKRKTLRNNLQGQLGAGEREANLRAEQLSFEQFVDLFRRFKECSSDRDKL